MDVKLNYEEKRNRIPSHKCSMAMDENLSYFKKQVDFFSREYRVITVDTRGHGKTPRGNKPFTIEQLAEDLYFFMEEQHIDKAHILGFSDGGNIAVAFALSHPEKAEKLILSGANLYPSGLKRNFLVFSTVTYKVICLHGKNKISPVVRYVWRIKTIRKQACPQKRTSKSDDKRPHIEPAQLAEICSPTLVIAGTHDIIKHEHTELIAANIPGSKLVFIKGGHSLAMLKPKEFNEVVYDFLKYS